MRNPILPALVLAAFAVSPALAQGSSGGDRSAAGGAFMSSYSQGPYTSRDRGVPREPFGYDARGGGDVTATGSVRRPAVRRAR